MRIKHTALVAGLFIATTMGMTSSVLADESSSAFTTAGNITFTSNYYYRGVSQTSNLSAVQGSLTVNHSSGLYASVWSSNVNNVISAGGQELDPSIGFTSSVGDVAYDVGVLQYGYPGDRTKSFREAYGSVSYKGAKLGLAYSHDFYAGNGQSLYSYLDYAGKIGSSDFGYSAHAGLNKFKNTDPVLYPVTAPADGYMDYKVGVNYSKSGFLVDLSYTGSDLDETACLAFGGEKYICKGSVVASVGKSF